MFFRHQTFYDYQNAMRRQYEEEKRRYQADKNRTYDIIVNGCYYGGEICCEKRRFVKKAHCTEKEETPLPRNREETIEYQKYFINEYEREVKRSINRLTLDVFYSKSKEEQEYILNNSPLVAKVVKDDIYNTGACRSVNR